MKPRTRRRPAPPRSRRSRRPARKVARSTETRGMELGIAAGEEYGIGAGIGGFVGERGEEAEFGAGGAPVVQPVRIEEGEGVVAGDGDALAERRKRFARACGPSLLPRPPPQGERCRPVRAGRTGTKAGSRSTKSSIGLRCRRDDLIEARDFIGQHQAEMAVRQGQGFALRERRRAAGSAPARGRCAAWLRAGWRRLG